MLTPVPSLHATSGFRKGFDVKNVPEGWGILNKRYTMKNNKNFPCVNSLHTPKS